MTALEQAARMAMDALIEVTGWQWAGPMRVMDEVEDAITALREALDQPQPARREQRMYMDEQELVVQPATRRATRKEKIVKPGVYEVPVEQPQQEPDPAARNGWVLREVLFDNGEPVGHREPQQEPEQPAWEFHARKLTEWLLCMSYNDSYFGEPIGLVKEVTAELNRLIGTTPPRREWVGLTEDDYPKSWSESEKDAASWADGNLKERNA